MGEELPLRWGCCCFQFISSGSSGITGGDEGIYGGLLLEDGQDPDGRGEQGSPRPMSTIISGTAGDGEVARRVRIFPVWMQNIAEMKKEEEQYC